MIQPIIIAHRGASGHRPEHTLAAYQHAIMLGADFIEPDLVCTKDGVLVARHEPYLGGDNPELAGADSTDVASRPDFAARKRTVAIDGIEWTGWFACDFTLAELKSLRARERLPHLRPGVAQLSGHFEVPTLDEIITLVRLAEARNGRAIGIYPETKHPFWHRAIGLPLEERLVGTLVAAGYADQPERIFIQSFEVGNLKQIRGLCRLPLVQLLGLPGEAPADLAAAGDPRSYDDLVTPDGLKAVAAYADAIGPPKKRVLPVDADGRLGAPTALVADAHAAGLKVHPWTFRSENAFLPPALRHGGNPAAHGDWAGEIRAYLAAGVDGLFADFPDHALAACGRAHSTAMADGR